MDAFHVRPCLVRCSWLKKLPITKQDSSPFYQSLRWARWIIIDTVLRNMINYIETHVLCADWPWWEADERQAGALRPSRRGCPWWNRVKHRRQTAPPVAASFGTNQPPNGPFALVGSPILASASTTSHSHLKQHLALLGLIELTLAFQDVGNSWVKLYDVSS